MTPARRIHWIVGWLAVAAFPITGWWMQVHFPGAYRADNGVRMMFRSDHIYLFLSGLLNLLLGIYDVQWNQAWRRRCQWAGSLLLVSGPPLFLWAFCREPFRGMVPDPSGISSPLPLDFGLLLVERPLTLFAVIFLLNGTLLHVIAAWGQPEKRKP